MPRPEAWPLRDKIISEMRRLGASPQKIEELVGPEPPRVPYCLLPGIPPSVEPLAGNIAEWRRRQEAANKKYNDSLEGAGRHAYLSFFGNEDPAEPDHRKLDETVLIEHAARYLLGEEWKALGAKGGDSVRKSVSPILKRARLDRESIRQNIAAEANRRKLELETKELNSQRAALLARAQPVPRSAKRPIRPKRRRKTIWDLPGPRLTEKELEQLGRARSTSKSGGRPKAHVDSALIVKRHNEGASFSTIAKELNTSETTIRRTYHAAMNTAPKPPGGRK